MFKRISTTQHNQDSVQIWRRGDITATITVFSNGVSMVSLKSNDGRHGQHTLAGAMDGNTVSTLLNHFAKSL